MIVGQLVHARMVFPGNINKFVNPSDQDHKDSYHVLNSKGDEIGIAYSKKDAIKMSNIIGGESFERRPIFKQFP